MNTCPATKSALLTELFFEYAQQDVSYCVLRNFEGLLNGGPFRDVDIYLDEIHLDRNRRIVERLAAKYGCQLYKRYRDQRSEQIYLFKRISTSEYLELKLDFLTCIEFYGARLIPAAVILGHRQILEGFYVAAERHQFLDKWLFCHLLGAPVPTKYHQEFVRICRAHLLALEVELAPIFGRTVAADLLNSICNAGFSALPKLTATDRLQVFLRALAAAPLFHLKHFPLFVYHRIRHLVFPGGEFVSVSGPDGSGKTTILEIARRQLEDLFGAQPQNFSHFRPAAIPRLATLLQRAGAVDRIDENFSQPHRGKESGFIGSLVRYLYYCLDYLFGYFTKIRPALVRREVVVYDRYVFDLVADPARSRIKLPFWIRKLGLRLLPLPHTAFFVYVTPEVVLARKQELTLDQIVRVNAAYLRLADSGDLVVLQNDGEPQVAVAALVDETLERRRARLRLEH
jgi:thymidylate kinase